MKRFISGLLILLSVLFYQNLEAREIKQSTAANVMVFMTDSADHIAGKTGLTLTITASKDGGAFSPITPTVTERSSGWYNFALTTTHTDTLGDLCLHVTATGADTTDMKHTIVANIESDTYTAVDTEVTAIKNQTDKFLFDASNYVKSTPQTTVTLAAATHTGAIIPTVTSLTDNVGITQAGADKVWLTTARALTDKASFTLTSGEYTNIWNTNISAFAGAGYAGTYIKNLYDNQNWNVWDDGSRTLTSGGYSGLTSGDIDNIWEYDKGLATGASAIGKHIVDYLNATVGSRSTLVASDVWGYATRALTDKVGFTISGTKTTLDALNDITAASVWASPTRTLTSAFSAADIDLIWDEPIAGHLGNGSTGEKLNNASAAGNPWATDISSGYAGQAGEYLRNVKDATDGDKEGADYSGIEKMIRIQR